MKKALITLIIFISTLSNAAYAVQVDEGSRSTNCTSSGQLCDRSIFLTLFTPNSTASHRLAIIASRRGCSYAKFRVFQYVGQGYKFIGNTGFLNPGQRTNINLRRAVNGRYNFKVTAEGKRGGCNKGRVYSWAVDLELHIR